VLESGNRSAWVLAIVLSGLLNITLFGIMPGMIQKLPEKPDLLEKIQAINVIHLDKPILSPDMPDPPLENSDPSSIKEQAPPKPLEKPVAIREKTRIYKTKLPKPELPFELNHKLPISAITLDVPPLTISNRDISPLEKPPLEMLPLDKQIIDKQIPDKISRPAPKAHYPAKELDSPLIPLIKPSPVYPLKASRRGIQGWVKVKFIVNTFGLVEDLEIIQANPAKVFDKNVIACVAQWKFKPGTVEGVLVSTLVTTTIKFQLE